MCMFMMTSNDIHSLYVFYKALREVSLQRDEERESRRPTKRMQDILQPYKHRMCTRMRQISDV